MQDLPKVPVPELEKTMSEYLRLMEPVLTANHHDRVKNIVKQFTAPTGLGPVLQQYLQEKRDAENNWVSPQNIFTYGLVAEDVESIVKFVDAKENTFSEKHCTCDECG